MKILFACHGAGNGGAERMITTLANEYCKRDHEVVLLTTRAAMNDYRLEPGIRHVRVVMAGGSKLGESVRRIRAIRALLKRERPDCVVSFSTITNIQVLLAAAFLGLRVIVSERTDPARYPSARIRRALRLLLYPFAERVVFQTPDARDYFPAAIRRKGVIIPNPIRPDLPAPFRGARRKAVVGIGSLGDQKHWSVALDACRLFFEKHPEYTFTIYGEGPHRQQLQDTIDADALLRGRVTLAGFSDRVVEEMNDARMYISSSDYEGISNSMLEALATGVPTICTDCPVGGARMVIRSGENGFLVAVGDYRDLADKMLLLAERDELCRRFSESSVRIRGELALDRILAMWEKEIKA